jgi:hypothetical protein
MEMKQHQIAYLIVLALLVLAPVQAEATSHTTSLAKLCTWIDCQAALAVLPKITQANSPIRPGLGVLIRGSGFGQAEGEFYLTGLWEHPVGDSLAAVKSVKLTIPKAPGEDYWTPTWVIGLVPENITQVRDQPVKLRIKTKDNKWSNEYPVDFVARRDIKVLPKSDVQGNCSPEADSDHCSHGEISSNYIPLCYGPLPDPSMIGWYGEATFYGKHWTCVGSSDGTDSFSASLKNDWRFDHAALDDLSPGAVTMSGFQKGTTSTNVSLGWNNANVSYVFYRVMVSIVGPKGVPH